MLLYERAPTRTRVVRPIAKPIVILALNVNELSATSAILIQAMETEEQI
jgi:hypothetical protein